MVGSRRTGLVLLSLGASVCAGPPAAAEDEAVVALPALNMAFSPNYIAEAKGFWEKSGLKVRIVQITGIGAMNAVLSKSADFSNSSGATILRANMRGQKVVAIVNTYDGLAHELVISKALAQSAGVTAVSPYEKRAQALKGKKIAVGSPNTIPHGYLRYFARKGGVDPEREITVATMQPEASIAALKSGAIDGFVQSLPWTLIPVQDGSGVLLSSGLEGKGEFPELTPMAFNGVVARAGLCEEKPTVCTRLVAGYEEAMRFMHANRAESLDILKKRMPGGDPAVFDKAFDLTVRWTPKSGRMSDEVWAKAQEIMLLAGMIKEPEKLGSFKEIYTNKFLK
jgi:ABC-type nitrate/sulfonate/bicarbonate transport system substrate-binding protein